MERFLHLRRLAVLLCLISVSAFSPSGEGPCYNIDGSHDTASSACYLLDTVGASMCCRSTEECRLDGLCASPPYGLVGQYDNRKAIRRRSCTDYTWQDPACLAIGACRSPPGPQPPRRRVVGRRGLLTRPHVHSRLNHLSPAECLRRWVALPPLWRIHQYNLLREPSGDDG